jgi:uncharacterized delta-60 repeat protein
MFNRLLIAAAIAAALNTTGVSSTACADEPAPRKVALLVGVNKYQKPGFKDLDFAEADVEAVEDELKKLGFEVTLLLGSGTGAKQATLANIEAAARTMVAPLTKNDVALVMLSGHGQQLLADPQELDLNKSQSYYCPVDALVNRPETQFSLTHLTDEILAPNVGTKLLLVDACRDIPADSTRGARNSKGIEGRVVALPEDTGVFFSCRAGQMSFERHELGHGLFTYCLLDGLRGAAARDGEIAWADLVAHVNRRIVQPDLSGLMQAGVRQVPIPAGAVPHTVLGVVKASTPTPVPAAAPKPTFGIPDRRFGDSGRAHVNFGYGGLEDAYAIGLQPDGKIVIAGQVEKANKDGRYYMGVARFDASGQPDASFDGDGRVVVNFGPFDDGCVADSLIIQPDGKIICGGRGEVNGWGYNFALFRLLPNGKFDPGFGEGGKTWTDLTQRRPNEAISSDLHSLALQPDGRIVAAGITTVRNTGGNSQAFAVARYLSSGRIDASFGKSGWMVHDVPGSTESVHGMALLKDGRIVIVGTAQSQEGQAAVVLRFRSNGQLDSSFGDSGVAYFDYGAKSYDIAFDVIPQGDRLLVLTNNSDSQSSVLLRLTADGSLDTTFGSARSGAVSLGSTVVGICGLPDGSFVMPEQSKYALVAVSANGVMPSQPADSRNPSATSNSPAPRTGTALAPAPSRQEVARCSARSGDGTILCAGPSLNDGSGRTLMTVVATTCPQ